MGREAMGAPAHFVTVSPRRFPVPWTFEDHNDACFIVKDAKGHAVVESTIATRWLAPPIPRSWSYML